MGDIIEIELRGPAPHENQTENWVFDERQCWVQSGRARWDDILRCAENPPTLWHNGDSTYDGLNDQMQHALAATCASSISMVHVRELVLHVVITGAAFGNPRKRVQARFTYRGQQYWLWVTDAVIEASYRDYPVGASLVDECCVTVSLSEPHKKGNGSICVYKLVAAVIQPSDLR